MSTLAQPLQSAFGLALPLVVAAILLLGLLAAVFRYQRTPRRGTAVAIIALALGLAMVTGLSVYSAYQSYVAQNTWTFGYSLAIQGNGTAPESLVAPIAKDESLLGGLHLTSGTANWSLVDTPKGRGLFVRFTGSATIETTVSAVPRPSVFPDTSPTMTVSTNCTAQPSNCTGPPSLWVFYSGPAGTHIALSISSSYLDGDLAVGWATYQTWPPAVPAA